MQTFSHAGAQYRGRAKLHLSGARKSFPGKGLSEQWIAEHQIFIGHEGNVGWPMGRADTVNRARGVKG